MKFTDKLEKLPKQTKSIVAKLSWEEMEKGKDHAVKHIAEDLEVEGFRKGKAPEKLVKEKVGDQKILEHASQHVVSQLYGELIKKYDLKPFADPKITLLKAPVGGEWEIRFEIAESPVLSKVPDYKKIAQEVKGDQKKETIWVPGKDEKVNEQEKAKQQNEQLQKIFNGLIEKTEIEISPLIMDEEVNRRMIGTYDEIKKLGLTVDQYLQARKETAESFRKKIEAEVVDIYKSEFLLDKIADEAKITVDEKDLAEVAKTAKTPEEKELFKKNGYFYTRLIRKQKTLDFLASL